MWQIIKILKINENKMIQFSKFSAKNYKSYKCESVGKFNYRNDNINEEAEMKRITNKIVYGVLKLYVVIMGCLKENKTEHL